MFNIKQLKFKKNLFKKETFSKIKQNPEIFDEIQNILKIS